MFKSICAAVLFLVSSARLFAPTATRAWALAGADFDGDGRADIALAGLGDRGVQVRLSSGRTVELALDSMPVALAAGDVNGDGKADLVVAAGAFIEVLLSNGDGTFQDAVKYDAGDWPVSVAAGDVNGDGRADLIVLGARTQRVLVLLSNADGTMQSPISYAVGRMPTAVAVGDFNGDGRLDMVVADAATNEVLLLTGNGDGKFEAAGSYAAGPLPRSLAVGDFNGDGIADVAVAGLGGGKILFLLGTTRGTLDPGGSQEAGMGWTSIVAADLDGRGKVDLIWANANTGMLSKLQGRGDGSFTDSGAVDIKSAASIRAAVTNTTTTLVSVPTGSATFGQQVTLTATVSPAGATGKVTFYDGTAILGVSTLAAGQAVLKTTLPAAGSRLLTALYGGDATFFPSLSPAVALTVNTNPSVGFVAATGSPFAVGTNPAIAVGDFNGDGKADLAVANLGNDNVTVLLGNGTGGFAVSGSPIPAGIAPFSVAVGDFNGDGKADLVTSNNFSKTVTVLLGDGSGGFAPATGSPFAVGNSPQSVVVGDFNGDGNADLAVVNTGDNTVTVLLGNGSGGFTPASGSPFAVGNGPLTVAVADFNGDGKADLAVVNLDTNNVTVLLGNGSGGFAPAAGSPFAVGSGPQSVAVGDFNGDGKADLAVPDFVSNDVTVLLGNGSGGFAPAAGSPFAAGSGPQSVAVGDFNGDRKADLAVGDNAGNNVTVLLGNGSGGFAPAAGSPFAAGTSPLGVVVADFNGDGRADLAIANDLSNDVTVLLGTAPGANPPSVSPSSGSGSSQAFAFTYTDLNGYQDISGAQIIINSTTRGVGSCYILFGRGSNAIALADDAGTPGPLTTLGAPTVLQNSQCSVLASISSQSGSGNTVTVTLYVVFKPAFAGAKNVYTAFSTNGGMSSPLQPVGTFTATVSTTPISAVSVTPASGTGQAQPFRFNYFDPNGYPNTSGTQVLFSPTTSPIGACYILFGRGTNQIGLSDDTGGNFTLAPLGGQTVLQNGQCSVFAANSYQSGSGSNLYLNLFVAFKPAFAGAKNIYSGSTDNGGNRSAFAQLGTWTVPATAPALAVNSVTPSASGGPSNPLTFVFSDPTGFGDIGGGQVIVNPTLNGSASCYIQFAKSGLIALAGDDGVSITTTSLGQPTFLQNSQCIVNAAASNQTGTGNYLSLTLFVTMKTAGAKNVYASVSSIGGATSGYSQVGSWNVTSPTVLTPVAVSPGTGAGPAGTPQYFTFTYSDPNGANDISGSQIIISPALQGAFSCYVLYGRGTNVIAIANDTATGFTNGTLGTAGTVQNSQCSIDLSKSFQVQAGNTVNLTLAVSFKPSYKGLLYGFSDVVDNAGNASNFPALGTFLVQ